MRVYTKQGNIIKIYILFKKEKLAFISIKKNKKTSTTANKYMD